MGGQSLHASGRNGASRQAIIVGGSVAGLFAANLLLRRGWDVVVLERAGGGLQSRGAGVALHPELEAIMATAGAAAAGPVGVRVAGRCAVGADGRILAEQPHDQFLTAWSSIHQRLFEALPRERYRFGQEVVALDQGADHAAVRLRDGTVLAAALVIAADGVRSTLRVQVAPDSAPLYAGYVGWRGMVEEAALSDRFRAEVFDRFAFVFPPGSEFIGYPVAGPGGALEPGRRRYNFLWYYPVDDGAALAELLTDASGRCHEGAIPPPLIRPEHVADIRAQAKAKLPAQFVEPMQRAATLFLQPIHDLASDQMAAGRVALIGDAAFVARPHVGVGVLKAGQDALALAEALDANADVPAALMAFAAARLPAGHAAVAQGRRLGGFIQRRQAAPWTDHVDRLSAEQVLRMSARPPAPAADDPNRGATLILEPSMGA